MSAEVYADDGYFAVIPEWVLDADISAQAVRLYAVLRRYADQRTMHAHPSRRTLADRMRVASTRTVDAALDDLIRIGALEIFTRTRDDGGRSTSGYRLLRRAESAPMQKMHPPVQQTAQGGAADCAPPVQQTAHPPVQQTAQLEPEPLEPEPMNQSPAPTGQRAGGDRHLTVIDGPTLDRRADALAREHYEATNGLAPFVGVRQIVKRALDRGGYADDRVRKALADLRGAGRPVTLQTLHAALESPRTINGNGHRTRSEPYRNPPPGSYTYGDGKF